MLIPAKYATKPENMQDGTALLQCKYCGTKFYVPPQDITPEIMGATCCEDPACVEKMNAEANSNAIADMKSTASKTVADAVATALGK